MYKRQVRKLMYEQVVKLQNERAEIEKQFAIEKASQVHLTVTDIKFFLKQLQKGKADDIRYRKTLINVFVNAIYLYDCLLYTSFASVVFPQPLGP